MNSESSSWEGKLSAHLLPRGKCHSLSPDPNPLPGTQLKGARHPRCHTAGETGKCWAQLPVKPTRRARLWSHTTGQQTQAPLVSREQERVKKEAANYSGNSP